MGIRVKTPENSWYFYNGRPRIQEGLYDLLVRRKGIPVEQAAGLIKGFYMAYGDNPKNNRYREALDSVTDNFPKFIDYVSERTGIEFKMRPEGERKPKHEEGDLFYQY